MLPVLFCVCEVPGIEPRALAACKASVLLPELKPQSGASSQVTLFQQPALCTLWRAAGAPSMSALWVLSPADLWAAVRRLEESKELSFLPAASGLRVPVAVPRTLTTAIFPPAMLLSDGCNSLYRSSRCQSPVAPYAFMFLFLSS